MNADIRSYYKRAMAGPKTYKLGEGAWVVKGALPEGLSKGSFDEMWALRPKSLAKIQVAGRLIDCPRWQQTYMSNYWFSGMVHEAVDLPDAFRPYLEWANGLGHGEYNLALANFYENGHHSIGAHSDNEPQLVKGAAIVSVSLGQERTFRIRSRETNEIVMDIPMQDNTYLVMGGDMQERYLHEVPKVSGKKGEDMGRRINLTFRQTKV